MSLTYDFILDLAAARHPPPARLLDFGCGGGEVVRKALARGFDAWGADTYEEGWEGLAAVSGSGAAGDGGGRIRRLAPGAPLPFADGWFDVVVTNQVIEHLAEPAPAVAELARVLRPGGHLVAIFPTREVVVEPHVKAPLVHRLRNGSAAQRAALRLSHALRLCDAPDAPREAWVRGAAESLGRRVFYRSCPEALALFTEGFALAERAEPAFMRDRLRRSARLGRLAPVFAPRLLDPLLRTMCVRLANAVLVLRREGQGDFPSHGRGDAPAR